MVPINPMFFDALTRLKCNFLYQQTVGYAPESRYASVSSLFVKERFGIQLLFHRARNYRTLQCIASSEHLFEKKKNLQRLLAQCQHLIPVVSCCFRHSKLNNYCYCLTTVVRRTWASGSKENRIIIDRVALIIQ